MRKLKVFYKIIIYVILSIVIITMINKHLEERKMLLQNNGYYFNGKKPGMKYILLWTKSQNIPFVYMGEGQTGFIGRKCQYTNCIVNTNESVLGTTLAYDAILFAGPELTFITSTGSLPSKRLPYQKYVFASIESPINYPLCIYDYDGFFNWTWTYRLDSDLRWGYITIKDINNNIVGPKTNMHWINWYDMDPVDEKFKLHLRNKSRAIAWFVSNCRSRSRREGYVINLRKQLKQYNLDVDVFGDCGTHICPRDKQDKCNELISKNYYFYLSFENAFSEDYVTEKLLIPLQNNVVPIVYGGANYSRFLPERSYLNARELGIYRLAQMIFDLINDSESYAEYFRWKNHYTYHKTTEVMETNEYCNMCAALNNETAVGTKTVYNEFSDFWEVYNAC